jgi:hypothetical protein
MIGSMNIKHFPSLGKKHETENLVRLPAVENELPVCKYRFFLLVNRVFE